MLPSGEPIGFVRAVKTATLCRELSLARNGRYPYGSLNILFFLIDKNVKPIACKIIDELVENKFPSDHYGIYTELEMK